MWFAATGDVKGLVNLVVAAIGVLVARAVNLPRLYDLAFCVAMVFTGWGEALGLYDRISWYDNVVHFGVPMLSAPVTYIPLARLEVLPDPRDDTGLHRSAGIVAVTFALGMTIGAVWEMLEWSSDNTVGSNLQLSNDDTVGDLFADGLGRSSARRCSSAGRASGGARCGASRARTASRTPTREPTFRCLRDLPRAAIDVRMAPGIGSFQTRNRAAESEAQGL